MISYFSLGVLFWEVQVSRSMVYEPMKSPSSLTLAAFHLELLMKKVRRYSCPLFESRHSHPRPMHKTSAKFELAVDTLSRQIMTAEVSDCKSPRPFTHSGRQSSMAFTRSFR